MAWVMSSISQLAAVNKCLKDSSLRFLLIVIILPNTSLMLSISILYIITYIYKILYSYPQSNNNTYNDLLVWLSGFEPELEVPQTSVLTITQ